MKDFSCCCFHYAIWTEIHLLEVIDSLLIFVHASKVNGCNTYISSLIENTLTWYKDFIFANKLFTFVARVFIVTTLAHNIYITWAMFTLTEIVAIYIVAFRFTVIINFTDFFDIFFSIFCFKGYLSDRLFAERAIPLILLFKPLLYACVAEGM